MTYDQREKIVECGAKLARLARDCRGLAEEISDHYEPGDSPLIRALRLLSRDLDARLRDLGRAANMDFLA